MKIIFLMPHLLHYFNLILNKVNEIPGVDLTVVIPVEYNSMVGGGGINQTRENVKFKVIERKAYKLGPYYTFRNLGKILRNEKPNIIITGDIFMYPFVFNIYLRITMKVHNIKLIMRSIPYLVPEYSVSFKRLGDAPNRIDKLPQPIRFLVVNLGVEYFMRRARAYVNKMIYRRPDAHLNYVDEAREIYGSYGVPDEKLFVTYNSPDTDALAQSEKAILGLPSILPINNCRILHVGRLVPWKRVDMLVRATRRLKDRFPDVELVVIGEGPEKEGLEQLAKELEIESDIIFIGGVYKPDDLARYFQASSVYVLAGVGGLSINDAMFYKLPIVCSECDGTEKMLVRDGYNGKYFEKDNEDDLFDKISTIIDNDELKRKMGYNSRQIVDNEINIHTVMAKWQDAFDYVLNE